MIIISCSTSPLFLISIWYLFRRISLKLNKFLWDFREYNAVSMLLLLLLGINPCVARVQLECLIYHKLKFRYNYWFIYLFIFFKFWLLTMFAIIILIEKMLDIFKNICYFKWFCFKLLKKITFSLIICYRRAN
jgi:hypothetical protein